MWWAQVINKLTSGAAGFDASLDALLDWDVSEDSEVESSVRHILNEVRTRGDEAVLEFTGKFDGLVAERVDELELSQTRLQEALAGISNDERAALNSAQERIRTYHEHQLQDSWSYTDALGNELGQAVRPLDRVGVYVPGGQASYPSSVLMTLVPAKVAGVEELVVTVPTPHGEVNETVLAALAIAGADRVFTIGGAQAVGALAYGTQTVPAVDKIVGPGNAYVATAKRMVFGKVGIDLIAGPSEVLIIADGSVDPRWTALDLFSQAEHDAAAQAILISPDAEVLAAVEAAMLHEIASFPRQDIIAASLEQRGMLIEARDMEDAVRIANRVAPEHLELHVTNPEDLLPEIKHAGAIFCGGYANETLGDYVAGPSHVLPTFGTARFASPLGVYDFQKRSSVIRISSEGAASLADVAVPLAESEGLTAHARAAAVRAGQGAED